jgi:bleomycin hydrolase
MVGSRIKAKCIFLLGGIIIVLALFPACEDKTESFSIEVLNSYTPVKNQGKSQMCWAYAMLSAIETEHIMRGDSVHLSVAWVERMMECDSLAPKSKRGMGMTLINLIQRYGLVPYDAMPKTSYIPPKYAFMLGARYTPLEFAHSVCAPDEYIGLGCSEDYPQGTFFEPDLPDNWEHNQLLNVTRDSLLCLTEKAVRQHHGVCWEGDISEQGFDHKRGVARLCFLNGSTTDDHCMAIVGLARDSKGEPFFVMKNSWGKRAPYRGLMFMSYDYFRQKTVAVFMPRAAL